MARSKNVIVVEDRLKEMFDTLTPLTNSTGQEFKPKFRYGNNKELTAFLKENRQTDTHYPLIWLEYPYEESHIIDRVELSNLNLIIAVQTNSVMYNPERLVETFKQFLLPLWDQILETFRRSNIIDTVDNYTLVKHPNYDTEVDKNKTPTIWDAIKVTFDTTINNKCYIKPNTNG